MRISFSACLCSRNQLPPGIETGNRVPKGTAKLELIIPHF
jgi:hypothetical protein